MRLRMGYYELRFDLGLPMWRETCVVLAFDWYSEAPRKWDTGMKPVFEIMFFNASLQLLSSRVK